MARVRPTPTTWRSTRTAGWPARWPKALTEGLATTDEDDATIELTVNTYHHQAVDHTRLAPGLRAVGWAASGAGRLVEALESRDGRWVVAVQCHPERTESTPDEFDGVWEAFVRAAREFAAPPNA